jgi:hypothetical protein
MVYRKPLHPFLHRYAGASWRLGGLLHNLGWTSYICLWIIFSRSFEEIESYSSGRYVSICVLQRRESNYLLPRLDSTIRPSQYPVSGLGVSRVKPSVLRSPHFPAKAKDFAAATANSSFRLPST